MRPWAGRLSALTWNATTRQRRRPSRPTDGFAGTGSVSVASLHRRGGQCRRARARTGVAIDTAKPDRSGGDRRCRRHTQRRRRAARMVTFTFSEAVDPGRRLTLEAVGAGRLSALTWNATTTRQRRRPSRRRRLRRHRLGVGGPAVHRRGGQCRPARLGHGQRSTRRTRACSVDIVRCRAQRRRPRSSHGDLHVLGGGRFPASVTLAGAHGEPVGADLERRTIRQRRRPSRLKTALPAPARFGGCRSPTRPAMPARRGSDTVSIDTANPSVTSVVFGVGDAALSDGDPQLLGDFTFSEAVVPGR